MVTFPSFPSHYPSPLQRVLPLHFHHGASGTSRLRVISLLGHGEFQDLIYPGKPAAELQERGFFPDFFPPTPLSPPFHQAWERADNSKVVIC